MLITLIINITKMDLSIGVYTAVTGYVKIVLYYFTLITC